MVYVQEAFFLATALADPAVLDQDLVAHLPPLPGTVEVLSHVGLVGNRFWQLGPGALGGDGNGHALGLLLNKFPQDRVCVDQLGECLSGLLCPLGRRDWLAVQGFFVAHEKSLQGVAQSRPLVSQWLHHFLKTLPRRERGGLFYGITVLSCNGTSTKGIEQMEVKPNTGMLMKNSRKESDKHPDYTGVWVSENGVEHYLDAYINTSAKGNKYMKLRMGKAKNELGQVTPHSKAKANAYQPQFAENDDIPF